MLAAVADLLRCPVCARALAVGERVVRCDAGHAFDVGRQGHVTLVPGRGDTPEMVTAREAVLGSGAFSPVTGALTEEVAACPDGPVLDVGAGTGHHLAAVLGAVRTGVALDTSTAALRRAARAHPRIGAVGADAWRPLPLRDRAFAVALCVFAPRSAPELARVLRDDGVLLVVTPEPEHLATLVDRLGLLSVPEDKAQRLAEQLAPAFSEAGRRVVTWELELDREQAVAVARMGPSGFHVAEDDLRARATAQLPEPVRVTASVALARFHRTTGSDPESQAQLWV